MHVIANPPKRKSDQALFYARQPIYDRDLHVWGYDLREKAVRGAAGLRIAPEEAGSVKEACDRRNVLRRILDRGSRAVLPFGERVVLQAVDFMVPPVQVGLRIPARGLSAGDMAELASLKAEGHVILAETGHGEADGLVLQDCDIICLDVAGASPADVRRRMKAMELFDAMFMARGVADKDLFAEYREMGFALFEGPFFKAAEVVPGKPLSPHKLSRLQIFRIIEQKEPDFAALTNAIQSDVSVSLRLIAYLNSASFAFARRITSIKQALSLLGWAKVRTWLRVILLADMLEDDEQSELLFLSVRRGKFLELVATQHPELRLDPGEMFLLGGFSLLDAIMGVPMEQILDDLPLSDRLKGALCRRKTEYLPLLQLAVLFEEPDWEELEGLLQLLRLDFDKVSLAVFVAASWVEQFFDTQEGLPK